MTLATINDRYQAYLQETGTDIKCRNDGCRKRHTCLRYMADINAWTERYEAEGCEMYFAVTVGHRVSGLVRDNLDVF